MSRKKPQRAQSQAKPSAGTSRRRWIQYLLLFCTAALVVNALIGDRGLTALLRVQREYRDLQSSLEAMRRDNARLREDIQQLRTDPAAIEEAARRELGLARKDELLFIIKDVPEASKR
jgi:cell division protein FtsB